MTILFLMLLCFPSLLPLVLILWIICRSVFTSGDDPDGDHESL